MKPKFTLRCIKPKLTLRSIIPKLTLRCMKPNLTSRSIKPKLTLRCIKPKLTLRTINPKLTLRCMKPKITLHGIFIIIILFKVTGLNKLHISQIRSYNNKVLWYDYSDTTMYSTYLHQVLLTYVRKTNNIKKLINSDNTH